MNAFFFYKPFNFIQESINEAQEKIAAGAKAERKIVNKFKKILTERRPKLARSFRPSDVGESSSVSLQEQQTRLYDYKESLNQIEEMLKIENSWVASEIDSLKKKIKKGSESKTKVAEKESDSFSFFSGHSSS